MAMATDLETRAKEIGQHIVDTNCTVRDAAKKFSISKSTVHQDITKVLPKVDKALADKVNEILAKNKAERHIRGGNATKAKYAEKYAKMKKEN